jgi:hypothetical protein
VRRAATKESLRKSGTQEKPVVPFPDFLSSKSKSSPVGSMFGDSSAKTQRVLGGRDSGHRLVAGNQVLQCLSLFRAFAPWRLGVETSLSSCGFGAASRAPLSQQRFFGFPISDFLRISDFGFRISPLPLPS